MSTYEITVEIIAVIAIVVLPYILGKIVLAEIRKDQQKEKVR